MGLNSNTVKANALFNIDSVAEYDSCIKAQNSQGALAANENVHTFGVCRGRFYLVKQSDSYFTKFFTQVLKFFRIIRTDVDSIRLLANATIHVIESSKGISKVVDGLLMVKELKLAVQVEKARADREKERQGILNGLKDGASSLKKKVLG